MAQTAEQSVLRRKAGARRAALGLAEMTPAKAMRLALAKAGDAVLKVPVTLRDLGRGSLTPDGFQGAMPDPALILRMEGPGGAVALAVLCPQVVAAVIEALTLGRVTSGAAPERKPTATDASLARRFVDRVAEGFAALAGECRGPPPLEGYAVTGRIADARVAAMALEDAAHEHLTVELELAAGAKSGTMHLIFPARPRAVAPAPETGAWAAALEQAVMGSTARLEAILCRFRLPLSEARALQVGDVVPLTRATLDSVELLAINGRKVMAARLGRSGALRAVRLRAPDVPPPAASLPREMGSLTMPGARAPAPAAVDLPEPAALPDLPGGGDAGGAEPLADLPAALDMVPLAMDLDLPD